jgi:cell wall-associated NlpC family hydrolase
MNQLNLEIIKTAKTWIDTPWQHHVGLKNVATDCLHFLKGVAEELNIELPEYKNYKMRPSDNSLLEYLDCFCFEIFTITPGSILVFRFNQWPSHVAIASDKINYMIHASQSIGKVVEQQIDKSYQQRLMKIYQINEEFYNE